MPWGHQGRRVFLRTLLAGLRDESAGGVAADLAAIAGAASQLRDRMAFEHWRQITSAVEQYRAAVGRGVVTGQPAGETPEGALPRLDEVLAALATLAVGVSAMTGAQADGMTRDDGWHLLTLGRQVERLVCMGQLLEAWFDSGAAQHELGFDDLLALFNSTVTYRSRYQGQRDIVALLDLVVLDAANPRSLASASALIGTQLEELAQATGTGLEWTERTWFRAPRELLLSGLCERGADGRYDQVLECARRLWRSAGVLSDQVGLQYFTHSSSLRTHLA